MTDKRDAHGDIRARTHKAVGEDFADFDFERACDVFYDQLFTGIPGAARLFHDVERQKHMFSLALEMILRAKHDDPELAAYLKKLGSIHRHAGIHDFHLDIGFRAFLMALDAAKQDLDAARRKQCVAAYQSLARHMGYKGKRYAMTGDDP